MRYKYSGFTKDQNGRVIPGATVSVYLAGTTTVASVYAASAGGAAVNSVTSGDDGSFSFWVDEADYGISQLFKIVVSAAVSGVASYAAVTLDSIAIVRPSIIVSGGTLMQQMYQSDVLADDGTVNLREGGSGFVFVSCNAEAGMWVVSADASVVKVAGTTNTATTDSDGNLCVFDSGTWATVKNRLGVVGLVRVMFFYHL